MDNWLNLSEQSFIRDFYDQNNRLMAVLIHNGVAVFIQCNLEEHFMICDDFLKNDSEITFVQCARIHNGMISFSQMSEEMFHVETLEMISKKCFDSL